MRPGQYAVTLNERDLGGNFLEDMLMGLFRGGWEPTHYLRHLMEDPQVNTFDLALQRLAHAKLIAPVYYIMSGPGSNQGIVVTRERTSLKSTRQLYIKAPNGWYILQTNYDWDKEPPAIDNRRKYGLQYMNELGRTGTNNNTNLINKVLGKWPIRNDNTAYSTIMSPHSGDFETWIW